MQKFVDLEAGKTAVMVSDNFSGVRGSVYLGKAFGTNIQVNMPTANTDNPILHFKNPTGSGVNAFIWRLRVGVETSNRGSHYHKWNRATVTNNGTEAASCNCNSSFFDATAACKVYSTPTVTLTAPAVSCDTFVVGLDQSSADMIYDFECMLAPGGYFVITGSPGSNNTVAALGIKWIEEAI